MGPLEERCSSWCCHHGQRPWRARQLVPLTPRVLEHQQQVLQMQPLSYYVKMKNRKPDYSTFFFFFNKWSVPRAYDLLNFTTKNEKIGKKKDGDKDIVEGVISSFHYCRHHWPLFYLYSFGFSGSFLSSFMPTLQGYRILNIKVSFGDVAGLPPALPGKWRMAWLIDTLCHNPEAISKSPFAPSTRLSVCSWEIPLDTSWKQTFYSMV